MPILKWFPPQGSPRTYVLYKPVSTIGRALGNDVAEVDEAHAFTTCLKKASVASTNSTAGCASGGVKRASAPPCLAALMTSIARESGRICATGAFGSYASCEAMPIPD